jgi:hypothetical protein
MGRLDPACAVIMSVRTFYALFAGLTLPFVSRMNRVHSITIGRVSWSTGFTVWIVKRDVEIKCSLLVARELTI